MMDKCDNLKNFLWYNFQFNSKKKYLGMIFSVWFMSFILFFFNDNKIFFCLLFLGNTIITVFSFIMLKYRKSIIANYLFDGVILLYLSLLFCLLSYILLAGYVVKQLVLALTFAALLTISALISIFNIIYNIKHDKYSKNHSSKAPNSAVFMIAAACGMMVSRVFFKDVSQDVMIPIIAIIFFIISMICTTGIGCFLRIYIFLKLKKENLL